MNLIMLLLSALNIITSCSVPSLMCNNNLVTTTVRPESCYTDKNCSLLYSFPAGATSVNVLYNYSRPVAQEFYQNERLIASCDWSYVCNKTVQLHPEYKLYTAIIGQGADEVQGEAELQGRAEVQDSNSDDDTAEDAPHLMVFNY